MKFRTLRTLLCVFALVLPALAQAPAHESIIDGRWEAKGTSQGDEQVTHFEFKNTNGEVSGTVTEGKAQPLEIRNGRLVDAKLTFDTMLKPDGGGDSVLMTWAGTVVGAGESISFTCTIADSGSRHGSQELEAKRVP